MLRVMIEVWRDGYRPARLRQWRPGYTVWHQGKDKVMFLEGDTLLKRLAHPEHYTFEALFGRRYFDD